MRTVVSLSGDRLVATHYGFYSTIVGVGILIGNLAIGALMSAAHRWNADEIVWSGIILVGLVAVIGLYQLDRIFAGLRQSVRKWRDPSVQLCRQTT
jgi:uncharacterized membrane protein